MGFKLTFTRRTQEGNHEHFEFENDQAIADQGAFFDFLRPLIYPQEAASPEVDLSKLFAETDEALKGDEPEGPERLVIDKKTAEALQTVRNDFFDKMPMGKIEEVAQDVTVFKERQKPERVSTGEPPRPKSKQLPLIGSEHSTFSVGEMFKDAKTFTKTEEADPEPPGAKTDPETVIASIHCPGCGLETAKNVRYRASFVNCPTCNARLFLWPVNDHKSNELGITYKANNIYLSAQERWEQRHGKADGK